MKEETRDRQSVYVKKLEQALNDKTEVLQALTEEFAKVCTENRCLRQALIRAENSIRGNNEVLSMVLIKLREL